jgi:small subunit ribosomal protein S1
MPTEQEPKGISTSQKEFQNLLEKDFKDLPKENQIIKATISEITKNYVIVDIKNAKMEGMVPIEEYKEELSKIKVGATTEIFIERLESFKGEIIVSRDKAKRLSAWKRFVTAFENQEEITGVIKTRIKGGYIFYAFDQTLPLFLPSSQLSDRPLKKVDHLFNTPIKVLPVRCDRARANGSVSRREILTRSKNAVLSEALKKFKEGDIVENAVVKAIPPQAWGAFLDLGNDVTALLHQSDVSHNRISSINDVLSVGQKIPKVVISKIDKETNRLSASIKLLSESPFENIEKKFLVGETYPAQVVKITDYGAFCLITNSDNVSAEGLVHQSMLDHADKNIKPSKVLSVSQKISVKVQSIEKDAKRISLSYKDRAGAENPWEKVQANLGKKVQIKIKNITDKGLFGEIVDIGLTGYLHFKEISFSENIEDLKKFKKNEIISVKIIDVKNEKIKLSKRALEKDPYDWFKENKKKVGSVISTKVVEVLNSGVKVAVDPEKKIIVMIRKNLLAVEPADCRPEIYNVGNTMADALIEELDFEKRKIILSPKAAQKKEQDSLIKKFGEGAAKSGQTLRSIFDKAIGKKEKKEKKEK